MEHAEERPLVTVLISTRNRPDELRVTLRELRKQTYRPLELIVIDDDSAESLQCVVEQEWPGATFLRNAKNLGLIGSRSLGMIMANGEFIFTLDDDASPTLPTDIETAVKRFSKEPELGILAFFVHNGENPPVLSQNTPYEKYGSTFIGCGNMIRKEVVKMLGGYRDFFVYGKEELEYSLRALRAGWRLLLFPSVVIHHRVSPIGRSNGRRIGHLARNDLWVVLLHMPLRRVAMNGTWKLLLSFYEIARRLEVRWGIWSLLSLLWGIPRIIKYRKPMAPDVLRRYDILKYRTITSWEMCENGLPVTKKEIFRWFRDTWINRVRCRSVWDRRQGMIGRSELASFSKEISSRYR